MKKIINHLLVIAVLLATVAASEGQTLDVTVTNLGGNKIQLMATATGAGFASAPNNAWADMNITLRIPKSAINASAPSAVAPAATPEVTGENTAFTGAAPKDVFTNSTNLSLFDVTTFGGPDDGFWYFQIIGSTGAVQSIPAGGTVLLYEFTVPPQWACPACVEVLLSDVPDLLNYGGISTTSFIDNAGMGTDVLHLVTNNANLPVEWLYVKATPKDNKMIQVQWATASEQNNAGFAVERSDDGGSTYHGIANVASQGNSGMPAYYSFNDTQVGTGVKYYYRIKQTDLDQHVRYSVIVTGMLEGSNYFHAQVKPNPVYYTLNLEVESGKKQPVRLIIMDMVGKLYKTDKRMADASVANMYSYDVAGYPNGTYVVKLIAEDGSEQTLKFIINR